jgi:hypothetical protein
MFNRLRFKRMISQVQHGAFEPKPPFGARRLRCLKVDQSHGSRSECSTEIFLTGAGLSRVSGRSPLAGTSEKAVDPVLFGNPRG